MNSRKEREREKKKKKKRKEDTSIHTKEGEIFTLIAFAHVVTNSNIALKQLKDSLEE